MKTLFHESLKIGRNGTINVINIKNHDGNTKVTYSVIGADINATAEEIVDLIKYLVDTDASVRDTGGKPEFIFSKTAIGGVKNWFAFNLVVQRKFMEIIDFFEEPGQAVDGC